MHAFSPRLWQAGSPELEASQGYMVTPCFKNKTQEQQLLVG